MIRIGLTQIFRQFLGENTQEYRAYFKDFRQRNCQKGALRQSAQFNQWFLKETLINDLNVKAAILSPVKKPLNEHRYLAIAKQACDGRA